MIAGRIYAITNICNGTKYIGQTTLSLEDRFKLHYADAKKERNKYRKLYIAMKEYGFDSFEIEELETVENNKILDEREIFWIEKLHTFENGYNETKGG
jgi:group I intron endonuclease